MNVEKEPYCDKTVPFVVNISIHIKPNVEMIALLDAHQTLLVRRANL